MSLEGAEVAVFYLHNPPRHITPAVRVGIHDLWLVDSKTSEITVVNAIVPQPPTRCRIGWWRISEHMAQYQTDQLS